MNSSQIIQMLLNWALFLLCNGESGIFDILFIIYKNLDQKTIAIVYNDWNFK